MTMQAKHLTPDMIELFEGSPNLFMRCGADGRENQAGEFWIVRKALSTTTHTETHDDNLGSLG
jgi:hypothetical protein